MEFQHFSPSDRLKTFVDAFYIFQSSTDEAFTDVVFPSGSMEMIFNLGSGIWESERAQEFRKTPPVELWGQVTAPLPIRSKGKHVMLGIRFLAHTPSYFLRAHVEQFNNDIFDPRDVMGKDVGLLHQQLLEATDSTKRIALVENFLIAKLAQNQKASTAEKIAGIVRHVKQASSEDGISRVASDYGITSRYLHKIVRQHCGLSPKSINRISRFQTSLKLVAKKSSSLTSVALDCGYFDQAHFIRDFKSFTGLTPSAYITNKFPVNQAIGNRG